MKKFYPLTPAQMLHQNWIEEYGTEQVAGLSVMAVLKIDIDFKILSLVLNEELKRQKCLCFRFSKNSDCDKVRQYYVPHEEEDFELWDLTAYSYEKAEEFLQKKAYETLPVYNSKCYDFKLLKMPDEYSGFFMHVDHRLMDGYAISHTLKDIVSLYCSFKYGTEYPPELADYEDILKKDLERVQNPKRLSAARDFWESQLETMGEPMYSDLKGREVLQKARVNFHNSKLRAANIEENDLMVLVKNYKLDAASTAALFEYCYANDINMTNLLLLGLRTYLSKVNDGQEDITIENFISRRTTPEQWNSGGCRTIMFPCRSKIGLDCDFGQAAEIIKKLQTKIYYHNNYDPAQIFKAIKDKYNTPEKTSYVSCYLTYQPISQSFENPALKNIDVRYKWFSNGAATKKMYLTVSQEADGGLNFSFHYQRACLSEHDIELLYYYLMRILFKGIENPAITLGELMAAV